MDKTNFDTEFNAFFVKEAPKYTSVPEDDYDLELTFEQIMEEELSKQTLSEDLPMDMSEEVPEEISETLDDTAIEAPMEESDSDLPEEISEDASAEDTQDANLLRTDTPVQEDLEKIKPPKKVRKEKTVRKKPVQKKKKIQSKKTPAISNETVSVTNTSSENLLVKSSPVETSPTRPQRRSRMSKQDMFKQTTLPILILAISALLILIFIIGSITRAIQKNKAEMDASIAASESIAAEQARLEAEMVSILDQAEVMASRYDFDGAVALIDSFSGNIGGYPQLQDAKARFLYSKEALVPWEDPNTIINLSFQLLIADSERAYASEEYGGSLKRNFITTTEFQRILERLYENNYILVRVSDFIETSTTDTGATTVAYKPLYLPEGKKPIVLTQTNVNYNLYLVDSDDDMVADSGGLGVASKLVLQDDGSIACEMVNADSSVSVGAYDLVPILDAFVDENPDFSYHGAKAVLALTGYNGLFGYRTHPDARAVFGEEQYEKDVADVKALANALTESGYELACYTYGNNAYGQHSLSQIQADMNRWNDEVVPILGNLDIMVFAQNSDINSGMLYSGSKFEYLRAQGFKYFLGFCTEGDPFTFIAEDYVRQGRLMVNGANLSSNRSWFNTIFDPDGILDSSV